MGIVFFLAIIIFAKLQCIQTRKCYVCGPEAPEPFKNPTDKMEKSMTISSCEDFEQSADLENFALECPDGYVGCITQIDDVAVIRTCDVLAINDCQTANGVKYCYCDTDLCNKKQEPLTRHKNFINLDTTDDEDILDTEASGSMDSSYDDESTHVLTSQTKDILSTAAANTTTTTITTTTTDSIPASGAKRNLTANASCSSTNISQLIFLIPFLMQIQTFR